MSEAKFDAPEGATHYMENTEDWLFTWFKKDENGKWLGRTDDMDCWDDNCGYECALILPIPRKNLHDAAPEMYDLLEECTIMLRTGTQEHAEECAVRVERLLTKLEKNDE